MIAIVLVSHGGLAEELLRVAERIAGRQAGVYAFGLRDDEPWDDFRQRLSVGAFRQARGGESLIMADIMGGAPLQAALAAMSDCGDASSGAVVSGLNLAMLIAALEGRESATSAALLARNVAEAGRGGIREYEPDDRERCGSHEQDRVLPGARG